MATIVLRSTNGSPLTTAEVDANFTNINTELGTKLSYTGGSISVANGNAATLSFLQTAQRQYRLGLKASDNKFYITDVDGGADRLIINTAGNVGIGANPNVKLELRSDTTTAGSEPNILLHNRPTPDGVGKVAAAHYVGGIFGAAYRDISTPAYIAGIDFYRDPAANGGFSSNGSIRFYTTIDGDNLAYLRTQEKMRIDSNGNVGIGTAPAQRLEVQDGNIQVRNAQTQSVGTVLPYGLTFRSTNQTSQDRGTIAGIKPYLGTASDNDFGIAFQTQATTAAGVTTKALLLANGNFGLGTTTPNYKLQVGTTDSGVRQQVFISGQFNFEGAYLGAANANGGGALELVSHVNSSESYGWKITNDNDAVPGALIFSKSANSSTYGGLTYTERMRIDSSGNVNIPVLTASQAVFTDASDNLVSKAVNGTGDVVLASSPTITGLVTAAGTTTVAPIKLTSGTILTSQTAGAIEYDGRVFLSTPGGNNRGLSPSMQTRIINTATAGATAAATTSSMFGVGTSLPVGKYVYEIYFAITHTGATATQLQFAIATTAGTILSHGYDVLSYAAATQPTLTATSSYLSNYITTGFSTLVTVSSATAATANSYNVMRIRGVIDVSVAVTGFNPQYAFVGAPTASTIQAGSYIQIYPVGASNAVTSIGNWA